jgi:hypothetical protein
LTTYQGIMHDNCELNTEHFVSRLGDSGDSKSFLLQLSFKTTTEAQFQVEHLRCCIPLMHNICCMFLSCCCTIRTSSANSIDYCLDTLPLKMHTCSCMSSRLAIKSSALHTIPSSTPNPEALAPLSAVPSCILQDRNQLDL